MNHHTESPTIETAQNHDMIRACFETLEDERRNLAHELHDDIGQSLTAIRTSAILIARQSEGRQSHSVAEGIVELTDRMFGLLHNMLHRLHPTVLDKLGMEDAITDLGDFCNKHLALKCISHIQGDVESLAMPIKLTIYRLIQESLTNASRHGIADRAEIYLTHKEESIHIRIENNGSPFDESRMSRPGMGILGMQKRIEAFGGSLNISNQSGHVSVETTLSTVTRAE